MLPSPDLEADLQAALVELASQPLAVLLHQNGILRNLARDLLMKRLLDSVQFTATEQVLVLSKLWDGLGEDPPQQLPAGWLEAMAPEISSGFINGSKFSMASALKPTFWNGGRR